MVISKIKEVGQKTVKMSLKKKKLWNFPKSDCVYVESRMLIEYAEYVQGCLLFVVSVYPPTKTTPS